MPRHPFTAPPTLTGAPTAAEMLNASAPLVRLVENYHRSYVALLLRSQSLRVSLLLLVVVVGAFLARLAGLGGIDQDAAVRGIALTALLVGICVFLVTAEYVADVRRLRTPQGQRMVRAVSLHSDLTSDDVAALAADADLETRFEDVHATWVRTRRRPPAPSAAQQSTRGRRR